MESLKRKPKLATGSFDLDSETKIDYVGTSVGKLKAIANNKYLSDFDKGVQYIAAKIQVNSQSVVADDILDCFSDVEFKRIADFITEIEGGEKNA